MGNACIADFPHSRSNSKRQALLHHIRKLYRSVIIIPFFLLIVLASTFLMLWVGAYFRRYTDEDWILTIQLLISFLIICELIIRIVLLGCQFFRRPVNLLDFVVTIILVIAILTDIFVLDTSTQTEIA